MRRARWIVSLPYGFVSHTFSGLSGRKPENDPRIGWQIAPSGRPFNRPSLMEPALWIASHPLQELLRCWVRRVKSVPEFILSGTLLPAPKDEWRAPNSNAAIA